MKVTGSRWPWQVNPVSKRKYGWKKHGLLGRFGGGWEWKLGISIGGSTIIIDLIFGCIRITWKENKS